MFFVSCFVFIATLVLALWFGRSLSLFTDQTFPTILLLVIVPTICFTAALHSFSSIKTAINAVRKSESNKLAQHVFHSCGNVALLVGVTISLINLMSIGYNWSNTANSGYLGVAIATVIMSTFIGLVVKVLCAVGFYRLQGEL
ncbi:MAG: hypothetical protein ACPGR2_01570 [Psychrobium sp.]